MNEKFNTWLSLFANLGILVSLILLIVELNQNTQITRIQIEQARSESFVQSFRDTADSEFVAPFLAKAGAGWEEFRQVMTPVEAVRGSNISAARFWDYENLHSQYLEGFVTEEYWEQRVVAGIKQWAPIWSYYTPPDGPPARESFKEEVRRILREP